MLRGEVTNLRAIEPGDAEIVYRWMNDPELMRFWALPEPVTSLASIQQLIDRSIHEELIWHRPAAFIVETLDGQAIGYTSLSLYEPTDRNVELSLFIACREHRRCGYGSDLVRTLVDAGFESWNVHRFTARVEAFNVPAQRLFELCGFRQEGRLREARFMEGCYHDVLIYGILRDDLDAGSERSDSQ